MNSLLVFKIKEGQAAILIDEVSAIIPDLDNPDKQCLVFSDSFPDGVTAIGSSSNMIGEWTELLEENQHEEAEEEARLFSQELDEED